MILYSNLYTLLGENVMRIWSRLAACAAALAIAANGTAAAAPCAGFTDVVDTVVGAAFCQHVEWLKNRAITLGCTSATLYCPNDAVSRLQMAAFLNRLGTALTPVQLRVDAASGAVDLDTGTVVCQTTDFAAEDFPRRAFVDLSFTGTAMADVNLAADLAMSTDGGGTWTNLNTVTNRGSVAANQWGGLSDVGYADLNVGQTVRWGVRMTRGGALGTTDLSDGRCQLRALVYSRDGTSSPF
jgi:hypothetical protein